MTMNARLVKRSRLLGNLRGLEMLHQRQTKPPRALRLRAPRELCNMEELQSLVNDDGIIELHVSEDHGSFLLSHAQIPMRRFSVGEALARTVLDTRTSWTAEVKGQEPHRRPAG